MRYGFVFCVLSLAGCASSIVSDVATLRSQSAGVLAMATLVAEEAPPPTPKPNPGVRHSPPPVVEPAPAVEPRPVEPRPIWGPRKFQAIAFTTSDCPPCAKLKDQTFPALTKLGWSIANPEDKAAADGTAQIIVLNADGGFGKAMAKEYKVEAFPTTIILNSHAEEVARLAGFYAPDKFSAWLNRFSWR